MRFDSQYKCGVVTKNIILSYNNPVKERLFKYKIKSLIYLLVRKGKRNEPSGYLRATKPNQIKSVLKKNFILCIYMYYYLLSFLILVWHMLVSFVIPTGRKRCIAVQIELF